MPSHENILARSGTDQTFPLTPISDKMKHLSIVCCYQKSRLLLNAVLYGVIICYLHFLLNGGVATAKNPFAIEYLEKCESSLLQLGRVDVTIEVTPPPHTPVSHYIDTWEHGAARQFFERRVFFNQGNRKGMQGLRRFAVDNESKKVALMLCDEPERLLDLKFSPDAVSYSASTRPLGMYLIDLQAPIYLLRAHSLGTTITSPLGLSAVARSVDVSESATLGGNECIGIVMLPPEGTPEDVCVRLTLYLDPQHGFLPRLSVNETMHASDGAKASYFSEHEVIEFRELANGAFLAAKVKSRGRSDDAIRELSSFDVTNITYPKTSPRSLEQAFYPNQIVQLIERPFDPDSIPNKPTRVVTQLIDSNGKFSTKFHTSEEFEEFIIANMEKDAVEVVGGLSYYGILLATPLALLVVIVAARAIRSKAV